MTRAIEHHRSPPGLVAGPGYSHVVAATGRTVAVSGQVAVDAHGAVVGVGDARAQAVQVFENLSHALAAVGASFADVIKFGFYCTDVAILPVVREIRDRYIDTAHPPASTAVQVTALVRPEFLLEVDVLAVIAE
jgi:enamine deaminase RidA (YjgF/YER057c/UK114 family)